MKNVMTNGFCELNEQEMMMVDGGEWTWKDTVIALFCPIYAPVKNIYEDLSNCYNNGYNEVMYAQ